VDETAPRRPTSERSRRRVAAEAAWLALGRDHDLAVHVFRLAGIYGPGRSILDQARTGRARRIARPGHLFSRIHVDDIAGVLQASMDRPSPGAIYNVCDDEAAAQADVVAYGCELLGLPLPPLVTFAEAAKEMSAMALSFWADNRRVDNSRIKRDLAVKLAHPDYRSGLRAVLAAEQSAGAAGGTAGGARG
jgi:nucleoside-diphosphate-sugar epimerase